MVGDGLRQARETMIMSVLLKVKRVQSTGMSKPVSFELQAEQKVVLFGESGTGKSVLFRALADLIKHNGEVTLNGTLQSKLFPENWRRKVMYFSAETAWWKDTADAHFETLPSEAQLDAVGLSLEQLKQPISGLSSGEKQRLALLRGLSYQPTILLLDEITANLDKVSTLKVENVVKDYCQTHQAAMIWISHDEAQKMRLAEPENQWNIEMLYQQGTALDDHEQEGRKPQGVGS